MATTFIGGRQPLSTQDGFQWATAQPGQIMVWRFGLAERRLYSPGWDVGANAMSGKIVDVAHTGIVAALKTRR